MGLRAGVASFIVTGVPAARQEGERHFTGCAMPSYAFGRFSRLAQLRTERAVPLVRGPN
jgi:hypothetical protein